MTYYLIFLLCRRPNHELCLGGRTLFFANGQTLGATHLFVPLWLGAFVHALTDTPFVAGILLGALDGRINSFRITRNSR